MNRTPACPYCGATDTTRADRYGNHAAHYCHHCHFPFAVVAAPRPAIDAKLVRDPVILPWRRKKDRP